MNEIGLDPGVDHMSAMKIIDEISDKGGKMLLFESFCGSCSSGQILIFGIINSLGLP
jgi:saccharopine dehydrogenase-like NADP-dependent oxidoreductase